MSETPYDRTSVGYDFLNARTWSNDMYSHLCRQNRILCCLIRQLPTQVAIKIHTLRKTFEKATTECSGTFVSTTEQAVKEAQVLKEIVRVPAVPSQNRVRPPYTIYTVHTLEAPLFLRYQPVRSTLARLIFSNIYWSFDKIRNFSSFIVTYLSIWGLRYKAHVRKMYAGG